WYHIQLVLYSHRWNFGGQRPQDWGYVWGKMRDLNLESNYPEGMRWTLFMIKAGQITDNGQGPDNTLTGWQPGHAYSLGYMVNPEYSGLTGDLKGSQWQQLAQALLQGWYTKTASYPYQSYTYVSNPVDPPPQVADPGEIPTANFDGNFEDQTWAMIPAFRGVGVSEALLDKIIAWSQGMWPNGAWSYLST